MVAGTRVEPVPGASALLAALVGSGLPTDQFHFGDFAAEAGQRTRVLEALADEPATLVSMRRRTGFWKRLWTLRRLWVSGCGGGARTDQGCMKRCCADGG